MAYDRSDWSQHYDEGKSFRPLRDVERDLLSRHAPAPDGGRALEIGCGTGELAAHLAGLGYEVDALDFAEGALIRARKAHEGVEGVRWLCLDIEHDDPADLNDDGYDLITMRLMLAFVGDRTRVVRDLAARLRPGGALVVITPITANTPAERRHIALDEDELALLTEGWEQAERHDADGLACLVLREPSASFEVVEKGRPEPQAVFGACVVVTDDCGRVLLGRSTRGMWELPGGRIESGESAQQTSVRELAEETGLSARLDDAHLLTVLHDERADVRRLSAVVRVTAWTGTPQVCEPHRFTRWEWHPPHTLASLGPVFAPSAQALEATWPGVLPGLPPVHSYPQAGAPPAVGGEPAEAFRLRQKMTDAVIAKGWAPSARVQQALRTVPRHRFAPEAPLSTAYDDNLAVVTRRDGAGRAVSSVSAAWLQADMAEHLRLEPGETVFEAGSGGYNAELLAAVTAPTGRVITVDLDPYVIRRTRRLCAEAGSGRVTAVLGEGSLGAPGLVPPGGFNGMVVTHNVWDIAPAWREQLAEGRFLVLPLEMHGYTRALALQRHGETLHARGWTYCGFVRDRGTAARITPTAGLAGGAVTVRWEDGAPADTGGLDAALDGPRHERATGVVLPGAYSFETLQLYSATVLNGFCRLTVPEESELVTQRDAAAMLGEGSLAYLTHAKVHDAPRPADRRYEFRIHAYGPAAPELAERFAACVQHWDRHVRETGYPPMTVHPAGTPDHELPAGHVLDKTSSRLIFQWPGHHSSDARPQALTAVGSAHE
ncbi:methyltransferase, FxLD system [Streptomyces diacarni]|uniref:methyltransferase, FxLD system n=1 Tax=Streptomyces diacarni TaxID=2800381 RepID=UPI0033E23693